MVGDRVPLPPSEQLRKGRGLNVGFSAFFYCKLLQTITVIIEPSELSARLRHGITALKKYGLVRFAWPARCPSAPLTISKSLN